MQLNNNSEYSQGQFVMQETHDQNNETQQSAVSG